MFVLNIFNSHKNSGNCRGVTWGRGGGGGIVPLPIYFLPKNSFLLATELNRRKLKNWRESGGKRCTIGSITMNYHNVVAEDTPFL